MNLESLPAITRISETVVRVLGQNPGKFTLQGTNTYIVGKQNPYTLIDTGEGREEYIPLLESALRDTGNPSEPHISDIILSHWHHDHIGGLPSVLALLRRLWDERNNPAPFKPPRLHKFPVPIGQADPKDNLPSIIESLPPDSFTPNPQGGPIHDLHDSQIISALQVLHTPGHTLDSICLYLPQDRALYTADTVLGQGTAVFTDLALYLSSLKKMIDFGESPGHSYTAVYPGHGPVVPDGPKLIKEYAQHRLDRENEIVALLQSPPPSDSGVWTTWLLVSKIYASYPESLWLAASQSVELHLKKLEGEGLVSRTGGEGVHTSWVYHGKQPQRL